MEILAAYDLTRSYRDAAEMCGVSHNTVKAYVLAREAGGQEPAVVRRGRKTDLYLEQMRSWVEASRGKIRGDVVHEKLVALGYDGSIRTTRYVLADLKQAYRQENARVHRPWTPGPGLWLQFDYGDGPVVDGAKTVLFCAWLAFCRFRVVIPLLDKTMPNVFAALDRCFRLIGGVPTYVLTDYVPRNIIGEHIGRCSAEDAEAPVQSSEYARRGPVLQRDHDAEAGPCQPSDEQDRLDPIDARTIAEVVLQPHPRLGDPGPVDPGMAQPPRSLDLIDCPPGGPFRTRIPQRQ